MNATITEFDGPNDLRIAFKIGEEAQYHYRASAEAAKRCAQQLITRAAVRAGKAAGKAWRAAR